MAEKLVWLRDGRNRYKASQYLIKKGANAKWFWQYTGWSHWNPIASLSIAKQACQRHAEYTQKLFE